MPRAPKPLSEIGIKNVKPTTREQRLYDGDGLYLSVMPSGARWWRLKYRFDGKERRMGLGRYPYVPLRAARELCLEAKAQIARGIDPIEQARVDETAGAEAAANTFEAVGREWLAKQNHMAEATFNKAKWTLEVLAFPWIGSRPISEITPLELLTVLRRVEARGKLETAQRLQQRCGQVFRYGVATGRLERDTSADLRGALTTPKTVNRAAITEPSKIGELLRAIDGYAGSFVTSCALKLAPLTFVRPGELRRAEWSEIDVAAAEWRIPAEKMKMRTEHIVPLSRQALLILYELRPLTGAGRYLFPSVRTPRDPMSENTVTAALRRMGYTGDEMTGHGFRAMASTRLNEMGYPVDHIERQLAHAERNKVRKAYNRAQYLAERRRMMQAWADYLDRLRVPSAA